MRQFSYFFLPLLSFMLLSARAEAMSITNLDQVPHVFTVDVLGDTQEITLLPWRSTELSGTPLRITINGYTTTTLEPDGKYAIWAGGNLALQGVQRGGRFR